MLYCFKKLLAFIVILKLLANHSALFSIIINVIIWKPVLVKIMTIQLHRKSILIQLQQLLWTCCVFLWSLNNTFFSVLVIIFSNKSYFCFHYRNTFFVHAMNYFSVVLRIIFLRCIKNYFLIGPENYFSRYRKFIFWSTIPRYRENNSRPREKTILNTH